MTTVVYVMLFTFCLDLKLHQSLPGLKCSLAMTFYNLHDDHDLGMPLDMS